MEQGRSMDTRHGIADTLISGASLLVGYLPYGISLTSPTVLATLAEDGPTRLTALAVTTKAAASAEVSLMQSAATASPEQVCSATTNAFDVGVAAAMAWARGEHEGI